MKDIIITNNPCVLKKYEDQRPVIFQEGDFMAVLRLVRDYLHKGHRLTTHPLSGSVKPNETPYKTVMISADAGSTVDLEGVRILEEAMDTVRKFQTIRKTPEWPESVLNDFQVIDLSLIENTIDKLGH